MDPNSARRRAIERTQQTLTNSQLPPQNPPSSEVATRPEGFDPLQLPQMLANAIAAGSSSRRRTAAVEPVTAESYRYSIVSEDSASVINLLTNPPARIHRNVFDPDALRLPEILAASIASGGLQTGVVRDRGSDEFYRALFPGRAVAAESVESGSVGSGESAAGRGRVVLVRSRVDHTRDSGGQYFHPGLNEWRDFLEGESDGGDGEGEVGETPGTRLRRRDRVRKRFRRMMVATGVLKKKDDDIGGAMGRLNISLPVPGSLRRRAL